MSTFKSLEEAQAYFQGDRFATEAGMTLDALGEKSAVCSVTLSERHRNANGGVMGGAIFTLADFAFAAAVTTSTAPPWPSRSASTTSAPPAARGSPPPPAASRTAAPPASTSWT